MWPVVSSAIDFVLTMQLDGGEIAWARSDAGILPDALLTGCASIYHSIRCALALATYLGESQPEWEVAVGSLGHAIAEHPESFLLKDSHSMEWYYPVLGGALRGAAARARIDSRWDRVRGAGTRHPVRRPPAMGDRRRDLRAGDGAGRHRRLGPRARTIRGHAPPARDRRLLLDRTGVLRRQAVAGGAHHVDRGGDDPGGRRPVVAPPAPAASSAGTTCRAVWKATSTAPARRADASSTPRRGCRTPAPAAASSR